MKTNEPNKQTAKISEEAFIATIKEAIVPCYGIKEIANISQTKGKKEEGIKIKFYDDRNFSIDIYVVVVFGLKITETLRSCQKMVKYVLNHYYPGQCRYINVYAYDLAS
ncbi:MAG TPA: Asp23/Gls24 family envelope stress response protein [Bacilli bacterium]|nr:Asp23/Gls24 family envelope stress response protein [Bacilli bacterium]HQA56096.1 Asp23/Gls24 family envelope stress response protein [Bacilli bacterium]